MLKSIKCLAGFLCLSISAGAAAESQDIMMLPLSLDGGDYQLEKKPLHITFREGYDNQPKFSADGKALYFTRMLDKASADGQQTDIYQYTFEDGLLSNVTQTEEHSEYSATPAENEHISVIGVNPDGEQHLRRIELATGQQQTLRPDIEPVGYHAWLNPSKAAVFVLGEPMTLQILDTGSEQQPKVLAENIGRCFETLNDGGVSFTVEKDGQHQLHSVNKSGGVNSLDITLPQDTQDYVWLNSQQVIVGKDSKLFLVSSTETKELADLVDLGVSGVTRLALSPDKSKLAVVYSRP